MRETIEAVTTGEVTIASRDAQLNGVAVRQGNYLGLAEGKAVAGGESFEEVASAVIERLLAEPRGLLTLLTGDGDPPLGDLIAGVEERHPDLELDIQAGGQPHYPLLLSAE
jgi:dihydroxyacetone kinase-like predicted kinase